MQYMAMKIPDAKFCSILEVPFMAHCITLPIQGTTADMACGR